MIDARFIADFNLCMEFYECTFEEAKFERKRVIKDYYNASKCFSVIAEEIRKWSIKDVAIY